MKFIGQANWGKITFLKSSVLLFIFCLIAYWPLSFNLYSLKNDAIIYFLPVRYTISECISNGYWPLWSPYLNLGYPIHMDMQSGVWNPFVQLISLLGSYTLKTLSYETMLYVYLSGLGMLFLLKHLKFSPHISLLIASAYMLSGFNSDSAQFLYWISGSAFLPFIFLFYYRMLYERNWILSLVFSFFLYIYFTTAYPGEFILLFYFLLGFTIWFIITKRKELTKKIYIQHLQNFLISLFVFVILALPAILSYISFLKVMDRGSGVSYDLAMSNSLNPALLFSYVLPLPIWRTPNVSATDPLLRNCFIGLIPFALLVCSYFLKFDGKLARFLKISLLISLLFSFGEIGLLRPISYYILPLLDTFRHPGIAKLFTNFSGCLLAAFSLQAFQKEAIRIRVVYVTITFILVVCLSVTSWAFLVSRFTFPSSFSTTSGILTQIKEYFDNLSFLDLTILNLIIQLPFIALLYFTLIKNLRLQWLVFGGILNCVIFSALFQPFTVVRTQSQYSTQAIINSTEKKGFPKPDINSSITANSDSNIQMTLKNGPLTTYSKKIAHTYNFTAPAKLITHNTLWNNKALRNRIFSYPLLYRADTIIQSFDSTYAYKKKVALVTDNFIPIVESNIAYQARLTVFTPSNLTLQISSTKPGFYCLQQNYLPNWKLLVDGKEQEIILTNNTFIGFVVNKGNHTITLNYEAPSIKIAYWLSMVMSVIVLSFMSYCLIKKRI